MPDLWTWLWIAWAAAFAVIEGVAVTNDRRGDTLSEHLRYWFRVDTHLGRTVWLVVSGVFLAWFVAHIAR
jgi:hypothetical protein